MQGFLPTLLEDVPDMAVKFAVYETLRPLHQRVFGGRQVRTNCLLRSLAKQHTDGKRVHDRLVGSNV